MDNGHADNGLADNGVIDCEVLQILPQQFLQQSTDVSQWIGGKQSLLYESPGLTGWLSILINFTKVFNIA